jgi:hypothetical protein
METVAFSYNFNICVIYVEIYRMQAVLRYCFIIIKLETLVFYLFIDVFDERENYTKKERTVV